MTVAALFVDTDGPYPRMLGAEACWDAARDARTYAGSGPVVAHPPCNVWGPLANVNWARWGGEHNRPGNDGGLFAFALHTVLRCGGVLEHPAGTGAWRTYGIPKPRGLGWLPVGHYGRLAAWTCCVWQSAYGHLASKATLLFYCGAQPPFALRWERPAGQYQIGGGIHTGNRAKPRMPQELNHITPEAFAHELIRLAVWSRG